MQSITVHKAADRQVQYKMTHIFTNRQQINTASSAKFGKHKVRYVDISSTFPFNTVEVVSDAVLSCSTTVLLLMSLTLHFCSNTLHFHIYCGLCRQRSHQRTFWTAGTDWMPFLMPNHSIKAIRALSYWWLGTIVIYYSTRHSTLMYPISANRIYNWLFLPYHIHQIVLYNWLH